MSIGSCGWMDRLMGVGGYLLVGVGWYLLVGGCGRIAW